MAWSRARLEQVAHGRLAKLGRLQPVERAALAYARWQGLTDETDIDIDAAKRALDKALHDLDQREPMDAWAGLASLADDLGDEAIIGLMRYSVERGAEQLRELEQSNDEPPSDTAEPSDAPKHKRKRERDL
jgi:hypothetical protein